MCAQVETPPLCPYPTLRTGSPRRMLLSSKHSIYISPHKTGSAPTPTTPRDRIYYYICSSPPNVRHTHTRHTHITNVMLAVVLQQLSGETEVKHGGMLHTATVLHPKHIRHKEQVQITQRQNKRRRQLQPALPSSRRRSETQLLYCSKVSDRSTSSGDVEITRIQNSPQMHQTTVRRLF